MSPKPSAKDMPIRIMNFDIDPQHVRENLPNFFPALGLSMTLPYLEPYLIRTMRLALTKVSDDAIAKEVKQFIGQEAQHYKQHSKLNDILKGLSPDFAGLQKIEDQMEADYQRFTKTKSLKFNLAYAEGFEAATCAVARFELERQTWSQQGSLKDSELLRLYNWHLTEEVEHRTVTFNIYKHLFGSYFYRVFVGAFGQYHFFKYVYLFSRHIEKNLPEDLLPKMTEVKPPGFMEIWPLLKSVIATYMPWYNPANLKLPESFEPFSNRFLDEASEIRQN